MCRNGYQCGIIDIEKGDISEALSQCNGIRAGSVHRKLNTHVALQIISSRKAVGTHGQICARNRDTPRS